mmetsp:Transcript_96507/g.216177  ORF Transcript_96507/g.216177 Transcript_96507/m.216177 type:complete len:101 (-) Transcript_96507:241-543(-)
MNGRLNIQLAIVPHQGMRTSLGVETAPNVRSSSISCSLERVHVCAFAFQVQQVLVTLSLTPIPHGGRSSPSAILWNSSLPWFSLGLKRRAWRTVERFRCL